MNLFGFSIVRTKTLKTLERKAGQLYLLHAQLAEVDRWFRGWEDIQVIFDYIFTSKYAYISDAREEYARQRNTTVYGEPK